MALTIRIELLPGGRASRATIDQAPGWELKSVNPVFLATQAATFACKEARLDLSPSEPAESKRSVCENCRHWFKAKATSSPYGECRSHPPSIEANGKRGEWPRTWNTDWCGEHLPKDSE